MKISVFFLIFLEFVLIDSCLAFCADPANLSFDCNNVHLHLNKTVFIAGESVAFRAYVYEPSKKIVVMDNRNVVVVLLNNEGETIAEKVVSYNVMDGYNSIGLNASIVSGNYFLRAYLESKNGASCGLPFVQEIKVYGKVSSGSKIPYKNSYELKVLPEAITLVDSILNKIAFKITSFDSYPIKNHEIELVEVDGVIISKTRTNSTGMGTFSFIPKGDTKYYLKAELKDTVLIKYLPTTLESGYLLDINHNLFQGYFTVSIKSKRNITGDFQDPLKLVIGSNGSEYQENFKLGPNLSHKELLLYYKDFPYGILHASIGNGKINILTRSFFNHFNRPKNNITVQQTQIDKDSVSYNISNIINDSSVNRYSISVFPMHTISQENRKSLAYSLYLNDRLDNQLLPPEFYGFNFNNNKSKHELDLLLQNYGEKADHKEKDIEYNYGYDLVGFINDGKLIGRDRSVLLQSMADGIFSSVKLLDNNFYFSGVKIYKKKKVHLSLVTENGQIMESSAFFHFSIQKSGKYNNNNLEVPTYSIFKNSELSEDTGYKPLISDDWKELIELDEVVVVSDDLKYKKFVPGLYYGRQIDSTQYSYISLGNFLSTYGYQRTYLPPTAQSLPGRDGWVFIKRKANGSILFPTIILDGISYWDIDSILDMPISTIDEVYFNRNGRHDPGTFIIFSQKGSRDQSIDNGYYGLDDGFDFVEKYSVPSYSPYGDELFNDLGILYWEPNLVENEYGNATFKFAHNGHKEVRIVIEGVGSNGRMIYWDSFLGNSEGGHKWP
tara:strand:- start:1014 stop:3353 length:2340 start_codon:yes stop_codon:yes gene_type:complete